MERQAMLEDRIRVIADLCRRGLDPDALRVAILQRLRRTVPVDALWWALTDPSTLLFTRTYREEIPEKAASYFVANEFLSRDVNRWTEVAREREGVRTLAQATGGRLHESARYRDVFEPLGLGDELRAAFRVEGTCWGLVCLHRERGRRFTEEEAGFIRRVAPHIAYGIRTGLVLGTIEPTDLSNAPGVVVLEDRATPASMTPSAEAWLEELGHAPRSGSGMPTEVLAVAAAAAAYESRNAVVPRLRVRTRAGRWVVISASRLGAADRGMVAVVIQEAAPHEVAPLIMLAYNLTERERTLTGLVCRGFSTAEIAARLHISPYTVQDHLKSVFDKVGVGTRGELAATILCGRHLAA